MSRHTVDHAAVCQFHPVKMHRRKYPRHCRACQQRPHQIAFIQHDFAATFHIHRRHRQRDVEIGKCHPLQTAVQFLTDAALTCALAEEVDVQQVNPAKLFKILGHGLGILAGAVHRADNRAHTGADDQVNRYTGLMQHIQHADMGNPPAAAAAKH